MSDDERPKDEIVDNDYELDKHIDAMLDKRKKKQFEASFNDKKGDI